ncbi:MAG: 6-bladed beta-propeller [bacterium]|nr:6-bladed beta-propeller [bacterium]
MKIVFSYMIVSFLLLGSSTASGQEIEIIDGVKTIYNESISPSGSEVKIEFVRKLGEIGGDDENLWFFLPADVVVDKEGNVYILDSGNYEIKKFSPDGKFMYTIGEKGQGPGEFIDPVSMDIDNEGNIVVADRLNNRFEVFSPAGKSVKSFRFGKELVRRFFLNRNDDFVMGFGFSTEIYSMGYSEPQENKSSPLLVVFNNKAKKLTKMGELEYYKDLGKTMKVNNGDFCVDKDDNYYITFENLNRIDKFGPDGKIIHRIERPLNYEITSLEKTNVKRSGSSMSLTLPRMNLVSEAMSADDKGRVWVATANRQIKDDEKVDLMININHINSTVEKTVTGNTETTETDMFDLEVFSSNGVLICRLRLDHFVDAMRIFGDRLFIIDQQHGMQVYEYRIIG